MKLYSAILNLLGCGVSPHVAPRPASATFIFSEVDSETTAEAIGRLQRQAQENMVSLCNNQRPKHIVFIDSQGMNVSRASSQETYVTIHAVREMWIRSVNLDPFNSIVRLEYEAIAIETTPAFVGMDFGYVPNRTDIGLLETIEESRLDGYRRSLLAMPESQRSQLLQGEWHEGAAVDRPRTEVAWNPDIPRVEITFSEAIVPVNELNAEPPRLSAEGVRKLKESLEGFSYRSQFSIDPLSECPDSPPSS